MKNINHYRIFNKKGELPDANGDFVLYWMQVHRRFEYNFSLEYAVAWANKLKKPLLILDAFSCDYPWATDRSHTFMLQGMQENKEYAKKHHINYVHFVETEPGQYQKLLWRLSEYAAVIISDEFPVFIVKERNRTYPQKLSAPFITVDSNGLIPLGLTDKDPYSAYHFRKIVQKNFVEAFTNPPAQFPLHDLQITDPIKLSVSVFENLPDLPDIFNDIPGFISNLSINHNVKPAYVDGARSSGMDMLGQFISRGLLNYADQRNNPDANAASRLSPWLHFGKLSAYEIVKSVLKYQPEEWDLDNITYNNGSTGGFFNGNPNIASFLDELITWREVGFHFAHHRDDYDQFNSLPGWALETMEKHKNDPRKWIYTFDELANAKTHDEIWNAAQTQLIEDGIIHNYLRMLWGKKVIEWTPDYRTALTYLIDLNNTYAIDGRGPNSYSGIFWCFGRFDRAWQERPVFGKLRYMTSNSTCKKMKLETYLKKYGTNYR